MSQKMIYRISIFVALFVMGLGTTLISRGLRLGLGISEIEARYDFLANLSVEVFGAALTVGLLDIYLHLFEIRGAPGKTLEKPYAGEDKAEFDAVVQSLGDDKQIQEIWDALTDEQRKVLLTKIAEIQDSKTTTPSEDAKAAGAIIN